MNNSNGSQRPQLTQIAIAKISPGILCWGIGFQDLIPLHIFNCINLIERHQQKVERREWFQLICPGLVSFLDTVELKVMLR